MGTHGGFGGGSSPALYEEVVVVLFDHTGQSFIAGFDRRTGTELWRNNRDESASWSTPLVIEVEGKPQVVAIRPEGARGDITGTGASGTLDP